MNLLSEAEIQCPLSALERVPIIEFFLKKIYENFVGTLETIRNRGVRTGMFDCTSLDLNSEFAKINCAAWKNDSRLKKSDFAKEISQVLIVYSRSWSSFTLG